MAVTTGGERWAEIDTKAETDSGERNSTPNAVPFRVVDNGADANMNKVTLDVVEQANVTSQPRWNMGSGSAHARCGNELGSTR